MASGLWPVAASPSRGRRSPVRVRLSLTASHGPPRAPLPVPARVAAAAHSLTSPRGGLTRRTCTCLPPCRRALRFTVGGTGTGRGERSRGGSSSGGATGARLYGEGHRGRGQPRERGGAFQRSSRSHSLRAGSGSGRGSSASSPAPGRWHGGSSYRAEAQFFFLLHRPATAAARVGRICRHW